MKRMTILMIMLSLASMMESCKDEMEEYESGDLSVRIEEGGHWSHDFPLFLGINKKNPPQVAIWTESMEGEYLSTVYVTKKTATASWVGNGGNRRKEALPHWSYSRGVKAEDGLYCPSKKMPLTDGMTGATPHGGFGVKMCDKRGLKQFRVKVEVNHSTDFNSFYCKGLKEGDEGYSGGDKGSGQPALVYVAEIDLTKGERCFVARLAGHSSPDGSDGLLHDEMEGITTAREIVKQITVTVK